jgi:hypothetical protein
MFLRVLLGTTLRPRYYYCLQFYATARNSLQKSCIRCKLLKSQEFKAVFRFKVAPAYGTEGGLMVDFIVQPRHPRNVGRQWNALHRYNTRVSFPEPNPVGVTEGSRTIANSGLNECHRTIGLAGRNVKLWKLTRGISAEHCHHLGGKGKKVLVRI